MANEQFKTYRGEFFSSKKSIHVQLKREDYITLRKRLVETETPIMKLFEVIVRDFVTEQPYTQEILKRLAQEKFKKSLERLEAADFVTRPPAIDLSFIDTNTIYDEIERRVQSKFKPTDDDDSESSEDGSK